MGTKYTLHGKSVENLPVKEYQINFDDHNAQVDLHMKPLQRN
jgi:hypothetical protein